ncbi:hypothetical protein A3B56_00610 [Candidatus Roizmanbacteria bacterium RIFCSPLOWO2_01_FULL_45_11]|uniref:Elongation factor P n=1 Tax=Candidatus Roizmanbacteria bacterium RIFCSPLOWO2_01_FULL_45_11 TaxID=1802070 RepID=A0A1F7JGC1_9BACT|nr:MAG: hypothetical protein A3B56_00610 [Candidatus Roizmanbacteria bacterium RIFCSPLOWO2_01_FULL_45_11]
MLEVTSLRNGMYYQEDGSPLQVLQYDHIKMGRGTATIKVKVKNLLTGAIINKSYISGKRMEEADIVEQNATYKYRTSEEFVFVDEDDEEIELDADTVGQTAHYLLKNMRVIIQSYNDAPMAIRLPIKVTYRVKEAPPDARGNSANASYKEIVLENNLHVKAPTFIKEGDEIIVDTRTGEYISRGSS